LAELIQYHVRVETDTGAEQQFVMREPRLFREGDRFEWQGHSYRVVTVTFDPARPRLAAIKVERTGRLG
jgi:urease accessory protein UreE